MPAALDAVLGGWQMSGIATFAQGQFQTLTLGTDWLCSAPSRRRVPTSIGDPAAGRALPDALLNPAAFDFPRDAQGNRIRVAGQRRAQQHSAARHQQLGYRSVQELPRSANRLQRAVPVGDVQHVEPHAVRLREPEHQQPDVRAHHEHARAGTPHAVRTCADVLMGRADFAPAVGVLRRSCSELVKKTCQLPRPNSQLPN